MLRIAKACISSGAQFVVSPALNLETIAYCREQDVAMMPGALTPTEVVQAWNAGADFVKVFPAGAVGGPSYLKSLKAPLPQIELVPTGGVNLKNGGRLYQSRSGGFRCRGRPRCRSKRGDYRKSEAICRDCQASAGILNADDADCY